MTGRFGPFVLALFLFFSAGSAALTAVWVNDGGDKVTRDELRASAGASVVNRLWDGKRVCLFGARNEVLGLAVILEAATREAEEVSVSLDRLTGPGEFSLRSAPSRQNGIFDWGDRQIELFYVRYLQIKGLSLFSYEHFDERQIPRRLRRPFGGEGIGRGGWKDRPDHDKFYPDIAVPLELAPSFEVARATSQTIWIDVFIPKTAPAGKYGGTLRISEKGAAAREIPVALKVRRFELPDAPSAKTMLYISEENLDSRYRFSPINMLTVRDNHFKLAHRHKISLIDSGDGVGRPYAEWVRRLNGTLFTPAHGYDGPGVGAGNSLYSIGTYGTWAWSKGTESQMRLHADAWVRWFDAHAPDAEYFLYLIDESSDYGQIETWAKWIRRNPGPGKKLRTFATLPLPDALDKTPSVDIVASTFKVGVTKTWEKAVRSYASDSRRKFWLYNALRPASGSFAVEDEGIAPRELAWGQFKKGIDRWFQWESTYYLNKQGGMGPTNLFRTAMTFGTRTRTDNVLGETGPSYSNGEGVLFYPGTDRLFPSDSYGVNGPIASLRLKHWRRGIQDVDYLTLARKRDPEKVHRIVEEMIPKVMWDYGVSDPNDPTWVRTDVSWPNDPDRWEAARAKLADIIEGNP